MVKCGLFVEHQMENNYLFYEKQQSLNLYDYMKTASSSNSNTMAGNKPFKCFILLTGKTLNSHNALMDRLKRQVPDLQVVQTEAECDIILVFCPVVRGPEHDIKAALEKLNDISGTKPAVLVVLHHTFDPAHVVSDNSRAVSRGNTIMVNCLFHEDQGLLQCRKNEESIGRIVMHIKPQIQRIKYGGERMEIGRYCVPTASHSVIPKAKFVEKRVEIGQSRWLSSFHSLNNQEKKNTEQIQRKHQGQAEMATPKYFILLTGRTLNTQETFIGRLKHAIPQLQQVSTVDECDVILAFCPVVSRAGTDIEAAVKKLNQESADRPAVLVVLHRTFDPECVVPNSSKIVHRANTITVDCLFYEDQGLLQCQKNQESYTRIINYIKPKICPKLFTEEERNPVEPVYTGCRSLGLAARANYSQNQQEKKNNEQMIKKHPGQAEKAKLKYFTLLTGRTLNTHGTFVVQLEHEIPQLQKVNTTDECDFILTFCPVVTRAGTDIEASLKKLNQESADRPAVLVVLHLTFDPECVVPDSSRSVHRANTITVDCLFYEDRGLLQCRKNQESFTRVINYITSQIQPVQSKVENVETQKSPVLAVSTDIERGNFVTEHDYKLKQSNKKDVLLVTSANHIQAKPDVENFEPMETQEEGGASQCGDKLENKTSEATLEIQLQEKDRQLEEMRTEIKILKTELVGKNEELKKKESPLHLSERHPMIEHVQNKEKDRHLREITREEKKLKEVKAELDDTIKNLEQKKKELQIVSKHLSEGMKVCEIKSELDSMQNYLQEKNKQIQEIIHPESFQI